MEIIMYILKYFLRDDKNIFQLLQLPVVFCDIREMDIERFQSEKWNYVLAIPE